MDYTKVQVGRIVQLTSPGVGQLTPISTKEVTTSSDSLNLDHLFGRMRTDSADLSRATSPYSRKRILLIDLDGTVVDWYGQLHSELLLEFPDDKIPSLEELTGYFWEDSFDKKYHQAISDIVEGKLFYRHLKPYPKAIECLEGIEKNHLDWIEPFICTKPSIHYEGFQCHSEKIASVNEHFGKFWAERTILTPDKTLVVGDFLIDDHPSIKGANLRPTWIQMLYDQPYNRDKFNKYRFDWNQWGAFLEFMRDMPLKALT